MSPELKEDIEGNIEDFEKAVAKAEQVFVAQVANVDQDLPSRQLISRWWGGHSRRARRCNGRRGPPSPPPGQRSQGAGPGR